MQEERSWKKVKAKYAARADKTQMGLLVGYRTKVVLDTLAGLRSRFPDLLWKSVGSVTLTSDFDITVSTPTGHNDMEAVLAFNQSIKSRYGVQPGTLFDTNLYSKDYAAVTGDARLGGAVAGVTDTAPTPITRSMERMGEAGQDVGSLMKQRRFMSWEEYDAYQQEVLNEMEADANEKLGRMDALIARTRDESERRRLEAQKGALGALLAERRATTRKQMEEADALYQLAQARVVKAKRLLAAAAARGASADGPDPILDTDLDAVELPAAPGGPGGAAGLVAQQQAVLHEAETLESEHGGGNPDLHMEISNKLYVKAVREVRRLEARVVALQRELDNPPEGKTRESVREEIDALLPVIKTRTSESVFFANEAYQTEGPIQHVVVGKQGGNARALDLITANQLLQSFNENMGDFLKDARHYAEEEAGKGFIQASKYIERMMDSLIMLKDKLNMTAPLDFEKKYGAAAALKASVTDGLLALRKDLLAFPQVNDNGTMRDLTEAEVEQEKRIYAEQEVARLFKVTTLEAIKGIFMGLNRELNAALRASQTGDSVRAGRAEERAYFGAAAGR
jgi:hypothetical protein